MTLSTAHSNSMAFFSLAIDKAKVVAFLAVDLQLVPATKGAAFSLTHRVSPSSP